MTRFARIRTPLGTVIAIAAGGALTGIHFEGGKHVPPVSAEWREDPYHDPLRRCAEQLADYLAGKRQCFDLPVAPKGTDFQQRVWRALQAIPPGETRTYGDLARQLGTSARAIGGACRANPCLIVVPCHRVIAKDGLGGFAGDVTGRRLEVKRWLLRHEGAPAALVGAGEG